MPGDSVSQASSSSAALSSASGRSIKSSNRQLMALKLSPSLLLEFGVFKHLDRTEVDSLPAGMQRMLDMRARLYGFSAGQHIVLRTHKKFVNKRTPDALLVGDAMFFEEDAEMERLGPIPNVELLKDIVESTDVCDAKQASKAIWHGEVHHKLLQAALRPKPNATKGRPVNVAITTSATVDRSICRTGPTKMIDFAMYIDPDTDDCRQLAGADVENKMRALRQRSGTDTANSTRYFFLRNKPVSVSIETKRSEGFETAILQMGTWHAAQWNFLEGVAGSSPYPGPEFLPGLIVVGDEWYFVASTRQGEKTVRRDPLVSISPTPFLHFSFLPLNSLLHFVIRSLPTC
ncbi:hypothetical protein CTA1_3145 [Colletotrichum tanaceti]|uniref:PD-(D/E)XK nuclease-like domain-containing protein n=1 Tax=Colletotrichum tanaceti TaxID=1306861 RepID=A0A4U6XVH8_9PEZI|nr:hypothetical protein CTA1_3145 [Colletotrichum tanaceti]